MSSYIQGDVQAFNELYARHKAKIYGYLVKRLPSRQSADEVFQSAFLKLHQGRTQYQFGQTFVPWMFTIVKNALYDYLRKGQSEARKVEAFEIEGDFSTGELDHAALAQLEDGMASLPEEQRDLLNKRYMEGLEFEEIAAQKKSNAVAVRKSVSRATRKLKDLLKGGSR